MLPEAALDVAAREAQIAAQEVDAGRLGGEPEARGHRLGARKVRERPRQVIRDPLDRSAPDQRPALLGLARCRGQCSLVGRERSRHLAEIVQDVTAQAAEGEAVGLAAGALEAALGQTQRQLVAVLGGLRQRRRQIGAGRTRIVRPVEMLGPQRRVAPIVPRRGPAVQLAPPAAQQAVVDRLADEGVGEEVALAPGAHQRVRG